MKTQKEFLLFLLATLLSLHCCAQKSFVEGYIIRNNTKDTVSCMIDYRNWSANPKQISVKGSDGQIQKMTVNDLSEFGITSKSINEVYRKKILDIDKGPFELKDLKDYPVSKILRDTVFAILYESGKINLYYLWDENARTHFLIEKNDTGIQDLSIERFLSISSQVNSSYTTFTQHIKSNEIYKNQLGKMMSDCPDIILKISDLSFKEKELRSLVIYYNKCVGGDPKTKRYSQAKEKVPFFIGPLLGAGFRIEKMSRSASNDLSGQTFGPGPNLDLAFMLGVIMPRTNKHLELNFELGWGYFHETVSANVNNYNLSATLAAHMLKGNIIFRYLVPVRKVQFAFSAGLSMQGLVASTNHLNEAYTFFGIPSVISEEAIPLGNWEAAFVAAAGVRIKNANIELRYFLNTSLSDGLYIRTFPNSLNLTFYYNFYTKSSKAKAK